MPDMVHNNDSSQVISAAPHQRRWLGSVITVTVLAALGASAWYLTHRPAASPEGGGLGGGKAASGASSPGGVGAGGAGGGRRGGPPVSVGVAVASLGQIPVYIEALGTVTPAASVTVKPQVSGVLQKILYTEGQLVRAGQVLALIDPRPFELALKQAQGTRVRDEAQLALARLNLERNKTMLAQDAIAKQEVDTQQAQVNQLEGTVLTDRAAEGVAKLNLDYTKVTAPVSGRVGLRVVDAGNSISSSDTGGLAVITQTEPIDVLFAIPQDRVPDVFARLQDRAKLRVTALDRSRVEVLDEGVFSTMDNQVDTQTGTVKAKARFTNTKARLFPNQFVNVRLLLDTAQDAVTVPVAAVRTGPDGDYVYVLQDDQTVTRRKVTRGAATAERVAISTGLKPGERVITEGADRLREGAKVNVPDARASGPREGGGERRRRRSEAAAQGQS